MAPCILVVNDNPDMLNLFHDLLTEVGFDVTLRLAPLVDMDDIERINPNLIIIDWMFGREAVGMDMVVRIKGRPTTASLPLLVCTGAVDRAEEAEEFLTTNHVPVLHKPFELEDMLLAISAVLPEHDMTDSLTS